MFIKEIQKMFPVCLCAVLLSATPAMAATKDDLNSSLQQTQAETESKQNEASELESQLEMISEREGELSEQLSILKTQELKVKKEAMETIATANETAISATQKAILTKDKDAIGLKTTAGSAEQVSIQTQETAGMAAQATKTATGKNDKIASKEEETSDSIDKITSEIEELKAKEAEIKAEIEEIEKEEAKEAEENASGGDRVYEQSSGGALTKSKGVVYYNGHRETYYSQRVLPGNGLRIPGRHVADDGTIRDEDGYICVAADPSYMSKGEIVETSLGTAKVYDSGCAYGTIDIYTDW